MKEAQSALARKGRAGRGLWAGRASQRRLRGGREGDAGLQAPGCGRRALVFGRQQRPGRGRARDASRVLTATLEPPRGYWRGEGVVTQGRLSHQLSSGGV